MADGNAMTGRASVTRNSIYGGTKQPRCSIQAVYEDIMPCRLELDQSERGGWDHGTETWL
ncbi:hypothetical protein SNOG_01008 [Parastagonospora nodorum SN15]|uniref:Uncharacterized protein n=1 Tax=Phaeosphaeria nodorum (strain SN15 / ATCC MYA-4574 / FGSC 10173) TaxID=321614 RepID=Q0V4Q6_PHANO|nr:hypothetical protein SNOG_01008 [Parastagonospora nodorum SN15]EAT92503.1 hypothetical protein SNOG_01008 [Parastagonospora nodorum SN15]